MDTLEQKEQPRGDSAALQAMERLMLKGGYNRSDPTNPDTTIEREGVQYKIEKVANGKEAVLSDVQSLFEKTFGSEEVDPEEILRAAVDGLSIVGEQETKYAVHVIRDGAGEVLSVLTGGRLDLLDASGKETGEQMFMVAYAVTAEQARLSGLAREAYISAIQQAAMEAQAEGKQLVFAAGEAVSTSEEFWNDVGWKRAYVEQGGKPGSYDELRYIQPALDFDTATGEPAEGAGIAPEHLMIDGFGQKDPDKEGVIATVQAFYDWCNVWSRDAFESDAAYEKHTAHVRDFMDEFKKQVEENGNLLFLGKAQRESMKQQGMEILDHVDADKADKTGAEDL